ncbi:MAG TPA: NADH-quinone oxidoreductase subunit L [Anaerolineae bacterium]|nr:NADH-quinone oxidoreductase subunit L [Anaerolineae bacterium]
MLNYVWLILLFPLAGVLVNAALGRWLPRRAVAVIASLAVGASFVVAALVLVEMLSLPPVNAAGGNGRERLIPLFSWIVSGDFAIEARILLDQLSIVMALVVTGVSALVHIYSIGYMKGERYHNRYFVWLNLFVLMMLILVLGDNFVTLYVGWEGVGLCSYLLIGYWFERESAAEAGKKAFIVNRVGDFGFALGILLIFANLGSLAFADVFPAAGALLPGTATAIALLLFLGATGKSAQIPLYVWLPDAMEGPTPVSALIHAATMVTAGVYMVARCHALFEASASALTWVAWIGGLTAFFAATIALVQRDFKRILAYSTISQLGYMFLGVGVGAYAAGIFHLTTHAFFKSLLFLCAGSVMHALGGELDIFKMGGLRRKLPWTFAAFLVGALALSGVPPFSGFFSKDEILAGALTGGHTALWVLGVLTAGLTAFYTFRLLFVAFYGPSRLDRKAARQIHESPGVMLGPMVVLALLAAAAGGLGLPASWGPGNAIERFLQPVFGFEFRHAAGGGRVLTLMGVSVLAAAGGLLLAYWLYVRRRGTAERWSRSAGWLYDLLVHKYYVDEAYTEGIVKPLRALAAALSETVEERGVNGAVDGLARLVGLAGEGLRRLQTGQVRAYALVMLAGVVAVVAYFVVQSVW